MSATIVPWRWLHAIVSQQCIAAQALQDTRAPPCFDQATSHLCQDVGAAMSNPTAGYMQTMCVTLAVCRSKPLASTMAPEGLQMAALQPRAGCYAKAPPHIRTEQRASMANHFSPCMAGCSPRVLHPSTPEIASSLGPQMLQDCSRWPVTWTGLATISKLS